MLESIPLLSETNPPDSMLSTAQKILSYQYTLPLSRAQFLRGKDQILNVKCSFHSRKRLIFGPVSWLKLFRPIIEGIFRFSCGRAVGLFLGPWVYRRVIFRSSLLTHFLEQVDCFHDRGNKERDQEKHRIGL